MFEVFLVTLSEVGQTVLSIAEPREISFFPPKLLNFQLPTPISSLISVQLKKRPTYYLLPFLTKMRINVGELLDLLSLDSLSVSSCSSDESTCSSVLQGLEILTVCSDSSDEEEINYAPHLLFLCLSRLR